MPPTDHLDEGERAARLLLNALLDLQWIARIGAESEPIQTRESISSYLAEWLRDKRQLVENQRPALDSVNDIVIKARNGSPYEMGWHTEASALIVLRKIMADALDRLEVPRGAFKDGSRELCDLLETMVLRGDFDKLRVELDSVFALARLVPLPNLRVPDADTTKPSPASKDDDQSDAGKDTAEKPEMGKPPNKRKGIPAADAENLVREWFAKHAKENPARSVSRDRVAAETGVSQGMVSHTSAWIEYKQGQNAKKKPRIREVPLTPKMQAVFSAESISPEKMAEVVELAKLIVEQNADDEADRPKEGRSRNRRHEGS